MKNFKLNPLELDKETIAKLDEQQLAEIVGGLNADSPGTTTGCTTGGSCAGGNSCNSIDEAE